MISAMIDFRDRHYLVTGGSRGIGRAVAERLRGCGAEVWVASRQPPEGLDVRHIPCDLADADQREELVAALDGVRLDGVLLNAGQAAALRPFPMVDAATLRQQLELNFVAPYLLLQSLYRRRRLAKEAAVVVNTAHAAFYAPAATSAYSAAKAALHAGLRSAARDLRGVRINFVLYGYVDTDLLREVVPDAAGRVGTGRVVGADEAAGAALFLLTRAAKWMNGSSILVDAGLSLNLIPIR